MRVLIVGNGPATGSLLAALETADVAVERRADDSPAADGPGEIAEIARDLREFERALGDGSTDAVVIASHSPASLAAVLVATRLGTPVARLRRRDGDANDDSNARLIRQLADTAIAPDPAAIVEWVLGGYSDPS